MEHNKIFRAYDIRGIYPNEINEKFAYELGKALAFYFKNKIRKAVVGSDVRNSSESLKKSFIRGLIESGFNVIDIGINPTPLVSFATKFFKAKFGVSITASHNPKEWNGFIINDSKCLTVGLEFGLEKIMKILESKNFITSNREGKIERINIEEEYIKFLQKKFNFESFFSVIIDAGNGSASEILPKILKLYNKGNNIELFCRFDGNFPNRDPEPKKENLSKLIEKILIEKADIGFAYDGDADRIIVVDDKGNVLLSHEILSLFMLSYGKKIRKKKIVIDFLSSMAAKEEIKKFDAIPIISRVGRTFIQHEMYNNRAFLAAESSYHFYFKEIFNLDDVVFATLKILEFLSHSNKKLSDLTKEIPKYFYKIRRVEIKEELKFKFIKNLKIEFRDYKIEEIDGIKVWINNDSWIALRASNTEPKISIAYESKNKKHFEELEEISEKIISKIKSL